jgi:hypothetical protein
MMNPTDHLFRLLALLIPLLVLAAVVAFGVAIQLMYDRLLERD